MIGKKGIAICSIVAALTASGCGKIPSSPVGELKVQSGERLEDYARAEGLSGKDIQKYVNTMQDAHKGYRSKVAPGNNLINSNGNTIYAGDTLNNYLDTNRDGMGGTKDNLRPLANYSGKK